jgi:hypothetical protein
MSSMVVSLLLKVRQEGAGALKELRDGLMGVKAEDAALGASGAYQLGAALRHGVGAARELKGALGEVRAASTEMFRSIAYGGLGAAGALFGFKEGFLDVAKEVGALRMRLIGLEGSDTRGDMALEWIKNFRDHTNASLAEVTDAWIELREHGVNPTKGAMQAVADTAAVTGASVDEVARVIGNAAEGGRTGSLRELGVSVKDLGSQMVVTYRHAGREITETLSKANHGVEAGLIRIIGLLHTGAAERASQGLGGQVKRLGEIWNEFAMQVMGSDKGQGGVMKYLADQLGQFVREAKEAGDGGKSFASDLAAMFKELIRLGIELMRLSVEYLPRAIKGLREISQALGGPKVVAALLAAVMAGPLIRALVALASVIVTAVLPAIYSLSVALLTTPVGWIILALMALAGVAYLLYDNWSTVAPYLAEFWDFLHYIPGVNLLVAAIDGLIMIAPKIPAAWQEVRAWFEGFLGWLRQEWDATVGKIERGIGKINRMFPAFGDVASAIGGEVKGVAQTIVGRAKLDIRIDSEGRASAAFHDEGGNSLGFDANLGISGVP